MLFRPTALLLLLSCAAAARVQRHEASANATASVEACTWQDATLQCTDGGVLHIKSATYGSGSTSECDATALPPPKVPGHTCDPDGTDRVRDECEGEVACELDLTFNLFACSLNPFVTVSVEYQCGSEADEQPPTPPSLSRSDPEDGAHDRCGTLCQPFPPDGFWCKKEKGCCYEIMEWSLPGTHLGEFCGQQCESDGSSCSAAPGTSGLLELQGHRRAEDRMHMRYGPRGGEDAKGGAPARAFLDLILLALVCSCQFLAYKRSRGAPHDLAENETVFVAQDKDANDDVYGRHILLRQLVRYIEFCGIEAKNTYVSDDGRLFIDEKSDCCQRIIASVNRELTLFAHAGPSKESPVVLRMYKPYHVQGCCCICRPHMDLDVPLGPNSFHRIGHIDDPFKWCLMDQHVYDSQSALRFLVAGAVCQTGVFCPCCADISFDVQDANGNRVGNIVKPALTCGEICTQTNRFEIRFPERCSTDDKRLLLGSAMLLDLQYFEHTKGKN